MHRIKKYANRKLYDTTDKKYISRTHLSELIRQGRDIVIIDNETGEDLTASIVSGLIATTKGKAGGAVSSSVLIQLFRKGGNALTDYAKKYVSFWQKSFTMAEEEIDDMVKALVKSKEISKSEGVRLKKEVIGFSTALKEWISDTIDRRLNELLAGTNLATKDHVAELNLKITTLERKLKILENEQLRRAEAVSKEQ
ncbi:polyhydroxyalkanoate synthesis repressor PhaR [Desulfocicer vacuolatum DSM 3385]|uniref:Polyhydroxyalkanoate synthesis repressor PhaR n=1 Tax=Desulfocicer vacuolatum DSM 3385 TaxID=1121400 RepID=A0A1W2DSN5_9BACT|nr:polyhydroxyalkanoate synthesis regulator DNA-binding domain-containing protein [Desulfocicer vacuolatum]SMD00461.1 polyhydroxyalkanoate synthesis repressor PhaR [Desulfocicer vacuolatum DSM 3385]